MNGEAAGRLQRSLRLATDDSKKETPWMLHTSTSCINKTRNVHVLAIEDPIEFLHRNQKASVSQRELGIDTASYNVALRAALRQDPDVILVGELLCRHSTSTS